MDLTNVFFYHMIFVIQLLCIHFRINSAGFILSNPERIGSIQNAMKYRIIQNKAVTGTPIAVHPVNSRGHCAYKCRTHLKCRKATFWIQALLCHLHSKTSSTGAVANGKAVTLDFLMSNETHYLIIGGRSGSIDQDSMYEVIPETKSAEILQRRMTNKRYYHIAQYINNKVIIEGGSTPTSTEIFTETELKPIDSLSFLTQKRDSSCSAGFNDKFYACFGIADGLFLSHCDVYSLKKQGEGYAHARIRTSVPGRSSANCALRGSDMYVVGGYSGSNRKDAYKLNLSDGFATPLANYPFNLRNAAMVWFEGGLVVCGGYTPTTVNKCNKYNTTTDVWGPFPNMIVKRRAHQLINWGSDEILALGGATAIRSVEVYEHGSWTRLYDLPVGLHKMGLINLDD